MKKYSYILICLCVLIAVLLIYKIAMPKNRTAEDLVPTENDYYEETTKEEPGNTMPYVEIPEDNETVAEEIKNNEPTIPTEELSGDDTGLGENDTDWVELVD